MLTKQARRDRDNGSGTVILPTDDYQFDAEPAAPTNGTEPEDYRNDPECQKEDEELQKELEELAGEHKEDDPETDRRFGIIQKISRAYSSFGANYLSKLSGSTVFAYHNSHILAATFKPNAKGLTPAKRAACVRKWASAHLSHLKFKLIGKNGELDFLLAAMLSCRLIGMVGYSGTGKTDSVRRLLLSIAKKLGLVSVVDCGTVYNKDQLIGYVKNGRFVPGLISGKHRFIILDEFSRMHGTLQGAVVKLIDEGEIRVDGKPHQLHPNFKIFVVYNGQEDGGTHGIIQAILDRLQVVINYHHVDRVSTKVNGRLTNGSKDWKADVGHPDDKFRGLELFDQMAEFVADAEITDNQLDLIDLLSEAVSESREGDFWAPGSQLSERATEILGRFAIALMTIRGITDEELGQSDHRTFFNLARDVLKGTAYNQLQKNVHREETKDALFGAFLNETIRKFKASKGWR